MANVFCAILKHWVSEWWTVLAKDSFWFIILDLCYNSGWVQKEYTRSLKTIHWVWVFMFSCVATQCNVILSHGGEPWQAMCSSQLHKGNVSISQKVWLEKPSEEWKACGQKINTKMTIIKTSPEPSIRRIEMRWRWQSNRVIVVSYKNLTLFLLFQFSRLIWEANSFSLWCRVLHQNNLACRFSPPWEISTFSYCFYFIEGYRFV